MKKLTLIIFCCLFQVTFSQQKILFITSNQHTYGDTKINTANHFEEIVLAYDVFKNVGYEIDIVSPKGGAIPIGYIKTSNSIQKKYLYDCEFMKKLKNTKSAKEVNAENYVAVYYSGGGSAMFGVPQDDVIQKTVTNIYNKNGVVSAVCHGTAGIADIKDEKGIYIFKNKKITGFPDAFEYKDRAYFKTFPFSIEEKVESNGGVFEYSEKGWDGFYLVDGRLVTGQDPTSSALVAKKVVELLSYKTSQKTINNNQTELEQINKVLLDYISGTANGQPERVRNAFHKDLKLYHVKNDSLVVWNGTNYVNNIKKGKKTGRIGRIISVDYENNAGVAKIEIDIPYFKRIYTDYLLLLKVDGKWQVIHKSFTFRPYPRQ